MSMMFGGGVSGGNNKNKNKQKMQPTKKIINVSL